ncbi:MAG: hypothetical protein DWI58_16295 [Chloroflexi bacterium]|nr:MAG: hypothetical protein DWI58_16295 [Chloroflexota bacterium]
MINESREKRSAYEIAKTMHRAFYELYYPVLSSGSRPAIPITDEALIEIARLAAVSEVARLEWEAAVRNRT